LLCCCVMGEVAGELGLVAQIVAKPNFLQLKQHVVDLYAPPAGKQLRSRATLQASAVAAPR
jgi:hypothetical protein